MLQCKINKKNWKVRLQHSSFLVILSSYERNMVQYTGQDYVQLIWHYISWNLRPLFVLLSLFYFPLHGLSFFDLRLLISPLESSHFLNPFTCYWNVCTKAVCEQSYIRVLRVSSLFLRFSIVMSMTWTVKCLAALSLWYRAMV